MMERRAGSDTLKTVFHSVANRVIGLAKIQHVRRITSNQSYLNASLASSATKKTADLITRLNYLKIVLYNIFIPNS